MADNTGIIQHDPANGKPTPPRKTPPRAYSRTGVNTLKRRLRARGMAGLDKRCQAVRLMAAWRSALVSDLGGEASLSAQEKALVDSAVRTQLLLGTVDAYLFEQTSIINKVKRSVFPVVRERLQLQDALLRILQALGLKRRPRDVPDLAAYLREREQQQPDAEEPHVEG